MDLKEIIEQIAKDDQQEIYSLVCVVDEVNEDERTCSVTPLNGGVAVFGVRLQAAINQNVGFVAIPALNSEIVVTFLSKQSGYVALFSEIDKILIDTDQVEFNGGANGGLVNINDLVGKLNTIENDLNNLKATLAGWVPVPNDGGAALKASLASYNSSTLTPTLTSDIEDPSIVH